MKHQHHHFGGLCQSRILRLVLFIYVCVCVCIYMAILALSCGMQDLQLQHVDLVP